MLIVLAAQQFVKVCWVRVVFFFFSSRRRHTRCSRDWSSDVCSSDLGELEGSGEADYEVVDPAELAKDVRLPPIVRLVNVILTEAAKAGASDIHMERSEERRVGKECRSRWSPDH